jgi:dipeptidyl aminopeptidase/acylaminoacyl peptidase
MTSISPYGTWPSPIAAADVTRGVRTIGAAAPVGPELWWTEARPDEGGRQTIVRSSADGSVQADLLPAPWNARTRVHEYGGRVWIAVPDEAGAALVFANFADQRLYHWSPGADEPVALTPEPERRAALRYAELTPSPDGTEIWCVREAHGEDGTVSRALVAVPLDGSAEVRVLGSDTHFMSAPRISPNGRRLAWIGWEHPNMPWDTTALRVAEIDDDGRLGEPTTVLGGVEESVMQPEWVDDETLYAIADRSGWWNLYRVGLDGGEPVPLCPRGEEFGTPRWTTGRRDYVVLADGRIVTVHGVGALRLAVLDPATGELTDLGLPYTSWGSLATDGALVTATATGPAHPPRVLRIDPAAGTASVVAEAADVEKLPDPAYLPIPEQAVFTGPGGRDVHAHVYPPRNPDHAAPDGELPPYVVHVHVGPTAGSPAVFSLGKAYFTSRGIGVIDVDYGGSTGYGREYRNRLRGQWGVIDVEDAVAAVVSLAESGRADRARLAIKGESAGGWTTLAALVGSDVFACGASYFGVSDLIALAEDTHDFESRYLDSLIGPLPEARPVYEDRAPVNRVEGLSCPVLLLQGEEDRVVPPEQSEKFAAALADKGIAYSFVLFAGEQHGFRKAQNQIASLAAELSFYGKVMGFAPSGLPEFQLSTGRDPETGKPFVTRR